MHTRGLSRSPRFTSSVALDSILRNGGDDLNSREDSSLSIDKETASCCSICGRPAEKEWAIECLICGNLIHISCARKIRDKFGIDLFIRCARCEKKLIFRK